MATILAADDEPSIIRLIQVTLEREGHTVLTAADGREALAVVAQERPDLIVLDVMMPHVDGFEALRQLKENADTAAIPVILLSAKRHDNDLFRGLQFGAVSYLTKPFNPKELIAVVSQILPAKDSPPPAPP